MINYQVSCRVITYYYYYSFMIGRSIEEVDAGAAVAPTIGTAKAGITAREAKEDSAAELVPAPTMEPVDPGSEVPVEKFCTEGCWEGFGGGYLRGGWGLFCCYFWRCCCCCCGGGESSGIFIAPEDPEFTGANEGAEGVSTAGGVAAPALPAAIIAPTPIATPTAASTPSGIATAKATIPPVLSPPPPSSLTSHSTALEVDTEQFKSIPELVCIELQQSVLFAKLIVTDVVAELTVTVCGGSVVTAKGVLLMKFIWLLAFGCSKQVALPLTNTVRLMAPTAMACGRVSNMLIDSSVQVVLSANAHSTATLQSDIVNSPSRF